MMPGTTISSPSTGAAHAAAQMRIEIHGAPVRGWMRANMRGRNPSSAITMGRREYDSTRELNMPRELRAPPSTIANFSHGPTRLPANAAHDPVSHAEGAMPLRDIAANGMA